MMYRRSAQEIVASSVAEFALIEDERTFVTACQGLLNRVRKSMLAADSEERFAFN